VIGIEGAGAKGTLYFDDIRLYPKTPQYVTPVDPGSAGLVALYTFDGNARDTSGNRFDGTVSGTATYGAGVSGQAIVLNGANSFVSVTGVGITGAASRTISGWAKASRLGITAWTNVFGFTGPSASNNHFDIAAVGDSGTTSTLGYYGLHRYNWERDIIPIDLEWHHLAATYDGTTARWYGDGMFVGSAAVPPADVLTPGAVNMGKRQDNTNFFPGSLDEVRIYNRALSAEEIAGLTGLTKPLAKPF